MNRREFLRTAGGATGAAAALGASGTATAQENGTDGNGTSGNGTGGGGGGQSLPPDYGGWMSDVGNYDGTTANLRGQDTVTVVVGAQGNGGPNAFSPPAIHVDVGTTVQYEWTGDGVHNVVEDGGGYESGNPVGGAGVNFEHTFEQSGISKYYCEPHLGNGMKGAVVVGDDYPAVQPGVSTPVNPEHVGVPFQAHWVGISTIVAILVTLMFSFYTLKYGESPNTKGGND